jgi:septum formation protein
MHSPSYPRPLVLASGSRYRAELLERLRLPFSCTAPNVDESLLPGEDAARLTTRLARAKAEVVARANPSAAVIGSDQVAEYRGRIIGKPGTASQAEMQLLEFSGQEVRFHTAVAVCCVACDLLLEDAVTTDVRFRDLEIGEVRRYVALERPLDCAGGFKSESAGPVLLQSMHSNDPTAIIGLPLIALSAMLRQVGFTLP